MLYGLWHAGIHAAGTAGVAMAGGVADVGPVSFAVDPGRARVAVFAHVVKCLRRVSRFFVV